MYSALKFQGQPLYRLARQGIEVERQARAIEIYSLQLVHFSGNAFKLYVRCSKGTYVRTLAEDICRAMGTVGHVTALRRTQAGPFSLDAAHTLESLAARLAEGGESAMDMLLLPASVGVAHWPAISLDELGMARVLQGQSVLTSGQREGAVRLIGPDEKFLGVGDVMADGRVQPRRLLRVP